MASRLFVDTWGWLTLRDRREARHQAARDFYNQFRTQGGSIYTTDYVLDETFTLIFRRLPFAQARDSMNGLIEAADEGRLMLEWITPDRFTQAQVLRQRFQDKPNISFTDLTSMVVMNEVGISAILTEDSHFTHVGMGFQLVP